MRYLRWIGLVSGLLIVGALGGLIAPLSSEAVQPTITITLDSGTAVSLLSDGSSSTCTTGTNSETANGYTACYSILLGTTFTGTNSSGSNRTYTVAEISAGSARLKLADTAGQDKFSLVGVKFVPAVADWLDGTQTLNSDAATRPNASEDHTITILMSKTFDDSTVNVANGGNYVWSVRSAGQFITGPTGGTSGAHKCNFSGNTTTRVTDFKCDGVSDRVDFIGVGTFSSTQVNVPILSHTGTKNLSPLSFTATGPHLTPHLSYDGASNTTLGQVNPNYPQFDCTSNANGTSVVPGPAPVNTGPGDCRPTITLTMTAKLFGPDTLQVINGDDAFCAKCSEKISTSDAGKIKFVQDGVKLLTAIETFHPKLKPLIQPIIDLGTLFLSSLTAPVDPICPGTQVLGLVNAGVNLQDALIVAQDPLNSPATAAVTGTIVVNKTIADLADIPQANPIPKDSQTFGFTGTGADIGDFSIITDQCAGSCGKGSMAFAGITTGGVPRTITETGFPPPTDLDGSLTNDEFWYTKSVVCESALNVPTTDNATQPTKWDLPVPGQTTGTLISGPTNQSGHVTVTVLAPNDTLTCTFQNGIFEIEAD